MICIGRIIVGVIMAINLKNLVLIFSFCLWLIYIFLNIGKELYIKAKIDGTYGSYLKENIWQIIRVDKLLLIVIFYLYSRFGNSAVDIYLFFSIMLYLLVNLLYEEINLKKVNFKNNWWYFVFILSLALILIGSYFIHKKLVLTLMLLFSFLYFFTFIFAFIDYLGLRFKKTSK